MDRRQFLKNSCLACMAAGAGISLGSCSPMPVLKAEYQNGKISIPETALAPGSDLFIVRSMKLDFDLLLIRKEGAYSALYLMCTHNQNGLTVTQTNIVCNNHGAEFHFDGKVKKGPASEPLRRFPVSASGGLIEIRFS